MNTSQFITRPKLANPWIYFLVTYAWSWFFLAIAYLTGVSAESGEVIGVILVLVALGGPMVTGISFVYLALNKEGQKDYWKRIIDYKRISFKWYLTILLLMPTLSVLAAFWSSYYENFSRSLYLPHFFSIFVFVLSVLLVPILEELGWRGYVLDRLQERYSALVSALILGALWSFWHLPVFFLQKSIFNLMPVGSLVFWLYLIQLIPINICVNWIYNNTGRSTLSAILFHIMLEIVAGLALLPWNKQENIYNVLLISFVATGIVIIFGPKTLVRKKGE